MDFAPMPVRPAGALTSIASKVWPAVRVIEAQRTPHAEFWDEWNSRAVTSDGPLWVALGDSSSQGIGADDPTDGWVPRMLERLTERTGEPWRVVNLSMTGAQLADIVDTQVPRLHDLADNGQRPALVTHLAGANDLLAPVTWPGTLGRLDRVLDALPSGSVVGRVGVSSPFNGFLARRINKRIEAQAAHRPFHLFWPWSWPSSDGLAADKWHPGPKGYGYMVDLIWEPISIELERRSTAAEL